MQAKRLLSCGFAFLFVLAFAGVSLAQSDVADFEGTWVRIERPTDGKFVGIGDTLTVVVSTIRDVTGVPIRVEILAIDNDDEDEAPQNLFDGATRDIDLAGLTAAHVTALTDKHVSVADVVDGTPVDVTSNPVAVTTDRVTVRKVPGDDPYTEFKFHFTVTSQAEESSVGTANADIIEQDDLFARVTFSPAGDATDSRRRVDNLNVEEQILPGNTRFSLEKVGDGKTFGIDNLRPIHGTAFKALVLKDKAGETVETVRIRRQTFARADDPLATGTTLTEVEAARINPNLDVGTEIAGTPNATLGTPGISTTNLSPIKKDGEVTVSVSLDRSALIDARAASATILFVEEKLDHTPETGDADQVREFVTGSEDAVMDSAVQTIKFSDIYRTGPLTADVDLSEGEFGDSLRVRVFGFLTDAAGNLGGTAAATTDAVVASGFWQNRDVTTGPADGTADTLNSYANLFLIDTTTPEITVAYPRTDTIDSYLYMSAKAEQDLKYHATRDGVSRDHDHSHLLKHLELKVSESVDSIYVSHGDSTAGFQRTTTADTKDFGLALPMWKYKDGEAGIKKKLVIQAVDQVGNRGKTDVGEIFYDGIDPEILNLFPTAESAPKDAAGKPTIDSDTVNPLFRLSEDLDSLSVRYVQKGESPPDVFGKQLSPGSANLKKATGLIEVAIKDTFTDGQEYYLQIVAVDPSGNAIVTDAELLRFNDDFENPAPDSFVVALPKDAKDMVVAGAEYTLNLSVLNKEMTEKEGDDVRAPTYRGNSRLRVVVPDDVEDRAERLKRVSFKGDDIAIAETDTGMGIATLDPSGWKAGARSIKIISEMELSNVTVILEDLDDQGNVNFSKSRGPVAFDKAKFAKFTVQAMEDGEATDDVIGDFTISVTATDKFGNASTKIDDITDAAAAKKKAKDAFHQSISIEFSVSNSLVAVPSGRQEIDASGTGIFDAVAPASSGKVVIRVYSTSPEGMAGVDSLNYSTETVAPPGAPGAPASLMVEDYKGPTGEGDQGGMVIVTFPNSADHATVDKYQIFREISVTVTSEDSLGNLVATDSTTMAFVPWAALSQEDPTADIQRAVIPALDNEATNWAVAAIGVGGSSGQTSATAKRVFTKESVQQTLALLGMPEAELLTDEELVNQFNAPEDYVASILGDQKNLVFAPVNPDVSVLLGNGSVPSNIRTSAHGGLASQKTATEKPAGARDDIAPAAATDAAGALGSDGDAAQVALSWAVSADDGRIVDAITYRGYSVPIYGLKGYRVLRGASADALESIGTVDAGSTEFVDSNLPEGARVIMYRIDAFDDDNDTAGQMITIQNVAVRAKFADADGPVYIVKLDGATPLTVDFEDFIAFAAAFGSQKGDENYNVQADVNDDGMVNFADFVIASGSFGRTAEGPASKLAVVPQRPGVNADTEMRLELAGDKVLVGETISVTVSMANARALNGYGLELMYDADKFEFVSAVAAEKDLLKSEGGETPLFKNWAEEGRVTVVNAIVGSGSVGGEGALVTFTFKVLREFEDSARFEIAQGVVFDPERLANPVVMLGALDVQSTPTEFALHQNYPNPFNPQTNIPYDLAEGGDVVLRIYNLLGQEVRTLVRERQAPGRYTVQWSGMDDRGVSVSSGIYFYQVSVAGKFQDAKRLMLLK